MCTVESIWEDAFADEMSFHMTNAVTKTEALIFKGYKIEKSDIGIQMLRPVGEHYEELTRRGYELICNKGWRNGIYTLLLYQYQQELEIISDKIRREVNTRRNDKHLRSLKQSRERITKDYAKISKQINNIN
tara:strand:+ start:1762 stop:2157 length:396 start_codon:yes stop_codon:yes gene_type:complete